MSYPYPCLCRLQLRLEIIEPVTNQEGSSSQSTPSASASHSPSARASPSIGISSKFETLLGRVHSLNEIYKSFNVAFFAYEPQNFEEVAKEEVWIKAMDYEIATIEKNNTRELVDQHEKKEVNRLKWVQKTKYKEDGSIQKHKA